MRNTKLIVASVTLFVGIMTAAVPALACYCEAWSVDGWGWGKYNSCAAAKKRALNECAAVTARNHWCYITYCK